LRVIYIIQIAHLKLLLLIEPVDIARAHDHTFFFKACIRKKRKLLPG
jgi:hypothetical protein